MIFSETTGKTTDSGLQETASDIEMRYSARQYTLQFQAEKYVLEESFDLASRHKELLGTIYAELSAYYQDAQTVFADQELPLNRKRNLLYHIYNLYFELLSHLPYGKRRAVKADSYIKKMHKLVKQGWKKDTTVKYWAEFYKVCLLPLLVGFTFELLALDIFDWQPPIWITILYFIFCIAAFTCYFVVVSNREGIRLYGGLQDWINYRLAPAELDRPNDLWQYVKMCIPLLVTALSALIKVYVR